MKRAFREKVACGNLVTEINASKFAYNISMEDINTLIIKEVLSLPTPNEVDIFIYSWKFFKYITTFLFNIRVPHLMPKRIGVLWSQSLIISCPLSKIIPKLMTHN